MGYKNKIVLPSLFQIKMVNFSLVAFHKCSVVLCRSWIDSFIHGEDLTGDIFLDLKWDTMLNTEEHWLNNWNNVSTSLQYETMLE